MKKLQLTWPAHWTRQQRSSSTMALMGVLMLVLLWLLALPLSALPEPIGNNAQFFAEGARITVLLTLISGGAGVVIGILAALGKLSTFEPIRWLANLYIWLIRGTPLLVQILFVYLALPALIPALQMNEFTSACVALALNVGAYNAEATRSGLLAIPKGQIEAAKSLCCRKRSKFHCPPWSTTWWRF
jgi:polar amino acid transport system permease protein